MKANKRSQRIGISTGRDSILHLKKAVVTSEVYKSVAAGSLRKKMKWTKCSFV